MGYTTSFIGKLKINKVLDESAILEIKKLNKYKPQERDKTEPLKPHSYCQWIVDKDKKHIIWDGQEKFYYYIEWLEYIIKEILKPKNYLLSGELIAVGEESEIDISKIIVKNNKITHKKFNKEEIAEYKEKQEQEAEKFAGDILFQSKVDCQPVENRTFVSLYEFLFKGIFSKNYLNNLVLIKEKDGSINLYNISVDELKNGKITKQSLVYHRNHGFNIPISKITEIIHYNSPLFKLILKTDKVYCICRTNRPWLTKELFYFQDDQIISKIKAYMPSENAAFLYYKSKDSYLYYVLFKKLLGVLVTVGLLICGGIGMIVLAIMISFIGIILLIFYLLAMKKLSNSVYYLSLNRLFKTKTGG